MWPGIRLLIIWPLGDCVYTAPMILVPPTGMEEPGRRGGGEKEEEDSQGDPQEGLFGHNGQQQGRISVTKQVHFTLLKPVLRSRPFLEWRKSHNLKTAPAPTKEVKSLMFVRVSRSAIFNTLWAKKITVTVLIYCRALTNKIKILHATFKLKTEPEPGAGNGLTPQPCYKDSFEIQVLVAS